MSPRLLWLAAMLSALGPHLGAQPVGSEFRVNTYTFSDQGGSAVARRPDGSFVVVWHSNYQDGSGWGVFGQRFSAAGVKVGVEFQVNNLTASWQRLPDISVAPDGGFVVVWGSLALVDSYDVAARRFESTGAPIGGEFRVNTYVTGRQLAPRVAHDAGGNFIVVWSESPDAQGRFGVFARRYDTAGNTIGDEFSVLDSRGGGSDVAYAPDGGFVVVADSFNYAGSTPPPSRAIGGQRFDSSGAPIGGPFVVTSSTLYERTSPSLAMDASGNFVVAWLHQPTSDIYARRFRSDGAPLGGEFRVNTSTTGQQISPSVASDADGSFLVAWTDQLQLDGNDFGVFAQRFGPGGGPLGSEFRVNTYTTSRQWLPSVASDGSGGFVVTWESWQEAAYVNFGVYAQLYQFPPLPKDYGDAPDPPHPTLAANGGPSHVVGSLFLGTAVDADDDGQPDAGATGDDSDEGDDEDGITFSSPIYAGATVSVEVVASAAGLLDAWVDFNADGDWNDPGEQVFASQAVSAGVNGLSIDVPPATPVGTTFSRWRLSSAGGLAPTGPAADGEVEDWAVPVGPAPAIVLVGSLSAFTTTAAGMPSAEQSYSVQGTDLVGDIVVTAPAEFEISLASGSGFGPSLTLAQSGGSVPATPIFVRYDPASAPGPHSGNITHASPGATTQVQPVSGSVSPPVLDPVPGGVITVGETQTLNGANFTAGTVIKLFVNTGDSIDDVSGPGFTPSAFTSTTLTFEVPPSVPLGEGFAAIFVVNTDQGFLASGNQYALLYGDAADNIPTVTAVGGTPLATTLDPGVPVAHSDTVVASPGIVTISGTGFNNPGVNLFAAPDVAADPAPTDTPCAVSNYGPFFPGGSSTSLDITLPAVPAGPANFQVVNSPYTGNVQSNAVTAVSGAQPAVTSVGVTGATVTVMGTGFSCLSVINLFNLQGSTVVNLGGLTGSGQRVIPLQFVSSQELRFDVPAGAQPGPAFVEVLNPPYIPFSSSGNDPDGSFAFP